MAKAKTGQFYISETIAIAAATSGTATHDISTFIDVANRQGLRILEADFIFQAANNTGYTPANAEDVQVQVMDLQSTVALSASDNSLIASGQVMYDGSNAAYYVSDLFPDNFAGKGRLVVNDTIYYRVDCSDQTVDCTIRLLVEVVTLSAKDFMAIALQSTQSDN